MCKHGMQLQKCQHLTSSESELSNLAVSLSGTKKINKKTDDNCSSKTKQNDPFSGVCSPKMYYLGCHVFSQALQINKLRSFQCIKQILNYCTAFTIRGFICLELVAKTNTTWLPIPWSNGYLSKLLFSEQQSADQSQMLNLRFLPVHDLVWCSCY